MTTTGSLTYKEAYALAQAYNEKLKATDRRFNRSVRLGLEDGASFFFPNAFGIRLDQGAASYYAVFTEHYGFHVFDPGDITYCQIFPNRIPMEVMKLPKSKRKLK